MTTKMKKALYFSAILIGLAILAGCSKEGTRPESVDEMVFAPSFSSQTKVSGNEFSEGDLIGVYITKYSGSNPSLLQLGGNYISNASVKLEGGKWISDPTIFWENGKFDIYAYYPRTEVSSVDALPFSVATNQSTKKSGDKLGGFEASDFLWAKTGGISRQESVPLVFSHKMSRLDINLIKGEDYEGSIPSDAVVYVHSTVTDAEIDLATGDVVKKSHANGTTIKAMKRSTGKYSAIVVPQRLSNRVPLVEVVCGGVSYLFESTFIFKSGTRHTVNLTLNNNPDKVKIEIGGEIQGDW